MRPRDHRESLLAAAFARRRFLTATGAAAALAVAGGVAGVREAAQAAPAGPDHRDPFTLGVASGDPLPDAVVIWTRLAPEPLDPYGGMVRRNVTVQWQVAEDEQFRRIVRTGTAIARPEYGHAVHVDVRGLAPWRHYHYRFRAYGHLSPVGRTRTAPAPDAEVSALRLAFASCQRWKDGFYTAHADMAARDHDLVMFLGDYIYERPIPATGNLRDVEVPEEAGQECTSLDQYRMRYALYKTDPNLQAAHAASAWAVTMDDHEVTNDWSPYGTPEFIVRQANAFRAYWENMPLRLAQRPTGIDMQLYRRLRYGRLAEFSVLDTRQYRSHDDGGWRAPGEDTRDPNRTITGATQEKWILDGLADSTSRWNVLAQQVMMMRVDAAAGDELSTAMGTWEGYSSSRGRILGGAHEREVDNLVVLTGDVHCNFAGDLLLDYDQPESPTVGTEFIGTSMSSSGDGSDTDPWVETILDECDHIAFANHQRGYASCTLTSTEWTTDYRVADRVTVADGTMTTRTTLTVADGTPGLQR